MAPCGVFDQPRVNMVRDRPSRSRTNSASADGSAPPPGANEHNLGGFAGCRSERKKTAGLGEKAAHNLADWFSGRYPKERIRQNRLWETDARATAAFGRAGSWAMDMEGS
jgi:hypothetical protein